MIISTEIDNTRHRVGGQERAVELIAKAGFDAFDFSMIAMAWYNPRLGKVTYDHPLGSSGRLAYARKIRQIGEDNGIVCNQSHAPFPAWYKEIADSYQFALECTAEAGGKICVMHPDNYKSAEENAEIFERLIPLARSCNVKIALENMCTWDEKAQKFLPKAACSTPDDFLKHLSLLSDEYVVACLDIGHAELNDLGSSAVDMINALGKKIQTLHIHDNDKIHDSHQIPFSGVIDYPAVLSALKKAGYSGDFTLECGHVNKCTGEEEVLRALCQMRDVARKLVRMYEEI